MKTLLINPFEKFSERQLLAAGSLFTGIGIVLCSIFNLRFIGILKMNPVKKVEFYAPAAEIALCLLSASLCLFILGKIINKKTRFIDLFITSLIAMFPLYLTSIFNFNGILYTITNKILNSIKLDKPESITTLDMTFLMAFSFVLMLLLVLFVLLLFKGFKTAANAKGIKHTLLFAVALIIADVISRIAISNLTF